MKKHRKEFVTKSELSDALFTCLLYAEMIIDIKKMRRGNFEITRSDGSFSDLIKFKNDNKYIIKKINKSDIEIIENAKKWYDL